MQLYPKIVCICQSVGICISDTKHVLFVKSYAQYFLYNQTKQLKIKPQLHTGKILMRKTNIQNGTQLLITFAPNSLIINTNDCFHLNRRLPTHTHINLFFLYNSLFMFTFAILIMKACFFFTLPKFSKVHQLLFECLDISISHIQSDLVPNVTTNNLILHYLHFDTINNTLLSIAKKQF